MRKILVGESYKDDVSTLLRGDDMFISGGDLALAGMAMGGARVTSVAFATFIASLSHILTRIVLSERLVFVYSPGAGAEEPPTSHLLPLIEQYCHTVEIDQRYGPISPVVEAALNTPVDVFGNDLVASVAQSVNRYAPWVGDNTLAHGLLAEYGVASLVGAPYAPNPFVSQSFGLHALKGRTTAAQLLGYIEDLRGETSKAMNLHEGLDIYDLTVPVIFGAVLRNSTHPADLVRIASQMNGEAKEFRSWCHNLDSRKDRNPDKYLEQLRSAKDSLRRLGSSIGSSEAERMQVSASAGGIGLKLPAPTLRKLLDYLDVDVRFYRPRSFLLNLHSSARQVQRLAPEVARVFGIGQDYARAATDHLVKLGDSA